MTMSRMVISPLPSMLGGRVSMVMTCSWRNCSSAAFSMVTMRSSDGMKDDKTLSSVVLPEPVPPDTTQLSRACTHALRNSTASAVSEPYEIRFSTVNGILENLRMVSTGPMSDRGGMMALTRLPSGRRASW